MKNLFWLLVGALITLLVPALLSGPINNLTRGDRLVGTMKVADWEAPPAPKSPPKKESEQPATLEELSRTTQELLEATAELTSAGSGARSTFAILTLKNNSDKVVNNVRVKFDTYASDVLLDQAGDKPDAFLKNVKEITAPEMKQGDELTYKLWSSSSSPEYLKEDMQTFSSSGPVRMTYTFPDAEWETERTTLEKAIEDWFPYIGLAILILCAIVMAVLNHHYETLIKAMLKDQRLYDEERQKYEGDPQKYNPAGSTPKLKE